MIQRINVIEKKPFRFTYGKLLMGLGSVVTITLLFYGVQTLRIHLTRNEIRGLNQQIEQMKQTKKELMEAAPPQVATGPNAELKNIFIQTPQWSNLLADLSVKIPPSVWLESIFASVRTPEGLAISGGDEEGERLQAPTGPQLILRGLSKQNRGIAHFLAELQTLPFVNRTRLTQSGRRGEGIGFTIECDMFLASR